MGSYSAFPDFYKLVPQIKMSSLKKWGYTKNQQGVIFKHLNGLMTLKALKRLTFLSKLHQYAGARERATKQQNLLPHHSLIFLFY